MQIYILLALVVATVASIGFTLYRLQKLGRAFRREYMRMKVERDALKVALARAGYNADCSWDDNGKFLVECYPNGNEPEMSRTKHMVTTEELRDAVTKAGLN